MASDKRIPKEAFKGAAFPLSVLDENGLPGTLTVQCAKDDYVMPTHTAVRDYVASQVNRPANKRIKIKFTQSADALVEAGAAADILPRRHKAMDTTAIASYMTELYGLPAFVAPVIAPPKTDEPKTEPRPELSAALESNGKRNGKAKV